MIAEIEEGLEILVLTSTSSLKIPKESHFVRLSDVLAGLSLQFKGKTSIMFHIIRQDTQGSALHFVAVVLVV